MSEQNPSSGWNAKFKAWLSLVIMGASWGLSFSLARLAATGGVHPLSIAFWESAIAATILAGMTIYQGIAVQNWKAFFRFSIITAIIGMVLPSVAFFYAASRVPAGVLSISVGIVPILTFVASVLLRLEIFLWRRAAGVFLGLVAIVLLVGPEGSLPESGQVHWVLLALSASAGYAALNIVIATKAPAQSSSVVLTTGMFAVASLILIPVFFTRAGYVPTAMPWTVTEWSLIGLGLINAVAFLIFYNLANTAGAVFVSLTANVVTLFGVLWGIILFGEKNSVWVWLSLIAIMGALLLITPRRAI